MINNNNGKNIENNKKKQVTINEYTYKLMSKGDVDISNITKEEDLPKGLYYITYFDRKNYSLEEYSNWLVNGLPDETKKVIIDGDEYTYQGKEDVNISNITDVKKLPKDFYRIKSGEELCFCELSNGLKNGYGEYHYSNKNKYKGNFKNDKKDGYGEYCYPDGSSYEGNFRNDERDGYGEYRSLGGRTIQKGFFKNGLLNGFGMYKERDRIYEGEFKDGKRDGKGIFITENGDKYEGYWENDKPSGRLMVTPRKGDKYEIFIKNNTIISSKENGDVEKSVIDSKNNIFELQNYIDEVRYYNIIGNNKKGLKNKTKEDEIEDLRSKAMSELQSEEKIVNDLESDIEMLIKENNSSVDKKKLGELSVFLKNYKSDLSELSIAYIELGDSLNELKKVKTDNLESNNFKNINSDNLDDSLYGFGRIEESIINSENNKSNILNDSLVETSEVVKNSQSNLKNTIEYNNLAYQSSVFRQDIEKSINNLKNANNNKSIDVFSLKKQILEKSEVFLKKSSAMVQPASVFISSAKKMKNNLEILKQKAIDVDFYKKIKDIFIQNIADLKQKQLKECNNILIDANKIDGNYLVSEKDKNDLASIEKNLLDVITNYKKFCGLIIKVLDTGSIKKLQYVENELISKSNQMAENLVKYKKDIEDLKQKVEKEKDKIEKRKKELSSKLLAEFESLNSEYEAQKAKVHELNDRKEKFHVETSKVYRLLNKSKALLTEIGDNLNRFNVLMGKDLSKSVTEQGLARLIEIFNKKKVGFSHEPLIEALKKNNNLIEEEIEKNKKKVVIIDGKIYALLNEKNIDISNITNVKELPKGLYEIISRRDGQKDNKLAWIRSTSWLDKGEKDKNKQTIINGDRYRYLGEEDLNINCITDLKNLPDGVYKVEYLQTNEMYVGGIKGGIKEGSDCVFKYSNGDLYMGDFKYGEPNGFGEYKYSDGDLYEGDFKNGKLNGFGKYKYSKNSTKRGILHEGEFKDNKRDGKGIFISKSGNEYEGYFKDDQPNGRFVVTKYNGDRHECFYENGVPVKGKTKINETKLLNDVSIVDSLKEDQKEENKKDGNEKDQNSEMQINNNSLNESLKTTTKQKGNIIA